MRYVYTATTPQGKMESGELEARSADDAAEQIRSTGLLIVSLRKSGVRSLSSILKIGWVPNVAKVTFAKHLSLMIKAGLPINEAVAVLADQAQGIFRVVLYDLQKTVESGRPLSDGLAHHPRVFSELFVAAVRAGEAGGTLEQSLEDLAGQLVKNYELQRKIRGAMIYPILVLTAATAVGLGLSLFVLPRVIGLFESLKTELPLGTRILLSFSRFMAKYGHFAAFGLVAGFFFLVQFLRWKPVRPFSHALSLRLPVFGRLIANFNLATFSRTMATLLRSGITIGEAFAIASNTLHNVPYKRALLRAKEGAESGLPASTVLEEHGNLFPSIATRMLAVGEQSGKFEETFRYLAEFYEDEVDNASRNLATIVEPVLLLLIGLVVAYVSIAIIAPIYNYIGSITRL